jgi:hypothetical protein
MYPTMFTSKEQPYCRACGRAIAKHTVRHSVHKKPTENQRSDPGWWHHVYADPLPKSKEECQPLTNGTITAVGYCRHGIDAGTVDTFYVWDGETYNDQYFCTGECARNWGYAMAKGFPRITSKAYEAAIAKRIKREPV